MGRAFEFRKARKLKRWGNMARTFTRVGKQIAIAVRAGGPDPNNNPHLRAIIASAKNENMPKENIDRAIRNAMGKDERDYKEMNYEGYGPFGVAILVETATDNTTRTVANVRSIFNKFSGSLGTMGSLDFVFTHKSMFTVSMKEGLNVDDLILEMIDLGVDEDYDLDEEAGELTIYGSPKSFNAIQTYLESNGFEVKGAEFTRIPNDVKDVTPEQRETIDKMVERLEDDEDVQNVYTNMRPLEEDEE
jgi:YebC/PmpR family DNA-binding regulatory protein